MNIYQKRERAQFHHNEFANIGFIDNIITLGRDLEGLFFYNFFYINIINIYIYNCFYKFLENNAYRQV